MCTQWVLLIPLALCSIEKNKNPPWNQIVSLFSPCTIYVVHSQLNKSKQIKCVQGCLRVNTIYLWDFDRMSPLAAATRKTFAALASKTEFNFELNICNIQNIWKEIWTLGWIFEIFKNRIELWVEYLKYLKRELNFEVSILNLEQCGNEIRPQTSSACGIVILGIVNRLWRIVSIKMVKYYGEVLWKAEVTLSCTRLHLADSPRLPPGTSSRPFSV